MEASPVAIMKGGYGMDIREANVWAVASRRDWSLVPGVRREIDFGFDKEIPEEYRERFRDFFAWTEATFVFPVTLWIDLKHRHYLVNRERQRMGYIIYFKPDARLAELTDEDDMPVADVPVRREKWRFDEILYSLIECITEYYLWLLDRQDEDINDHADDTEEILKLYQAYLGAPENYWD